MGEGVLIDTDVLIDFVRGRAELPKAKVHYISEITLYEFVRGTRDLRRAKDLLEETFSVLWVDNDVILTASRLWRELRARGEPVEDRDLIIAATAIARGLPLKTKNRRHFKRFTRDGLKLD